MPHFPPALPTPICALAGVPSQWLILGGACMLGLMGGMAFLLRASPARADKGVPRPLWQRLHGENGTATIEFALVIPILLFFLLMLIQIGMLMVGYQFVQHAAFRAARTAIVQIPGNQPGEPVNQINAGGDSGKFGFINTAARYAVMPACGELDGATSAAGPVLADGMRQYFSAYGQGAPKWVDNLLAARTEYAAKKTRVKLLNASRNGLDAGDFSQLPEFSGMVTYGPKDPVVVQVEHDMNLSVPYVRKFFQDGTQTTRAGEGAYTTITTRGILSNEGVDMTIQPPPFPRSN